MAFFQFFGALYHQISWQLWCSQFSVRAHRQLALPIVVIVEVLDIIPGVFNAVVIAVVVSHLKLENCKCLFQTENNYQFLIT